jgi:2-oxoglutarate ferredoxin oxidoreductase subunit beta
MERAADHPGCAFIEVYQNCNIFNHKTWFYASQKDSRPNNTVDLVNGEPLIFGEHRDKGVMIAHGRPMAVTLGTGGVTEKNLLVHDETDRTLAFTLANMRCPDLPEPLGVLYCNPDRPAYEVANRDQVKRAQEAKPNANIVDLVRGPDTWTVEG